MEINPFVFKSYDIRGIYPKELNNDAAFKIGQAFANYTGAQNVVVGRDGRLFSPALANSLISGLASQGCNVYNIGEVPTEGMYFATTHFDYDAGIMVTASHNPKEYGGFKMIKRDSKDNYNVVRGKELADSTKEKFENSEVFGEIKDLNIWQEFISHLFSFAPLENINPFKIVVDASNGMAGKVIPLMEDKLPIEIIPLNFNIDGNFPNHEPNPLLKESTVEIKSRIIREKADFGVIFDGDADRIFLIDEKGELVRGDIGLLFLAKYFLKKYPGKTIAYNLICSKAVPEFIQKMGGIPIRVKVGAVNLREALMKNDGIVSGEIAGHYSFRDNYYFDSGFIALFVLLKIISESNQKVSEMVKEYSIYEISAGINFEVEDKEKMIEKVKKKYFDGKQDFLDGLTVEYDNWWFNLRSSNTEPLLRLTVEAENKKELEKRIKEISNLIKP